MNPDSPIPTRAALVRPAIATAVVGVLGVVWGALVAGTAGVIAAVMATVVVLAFFVLLPTLVTRLAKDYPSLVLRVREAITETLTGLLLAGELDAIIAAEPIAGRGLESRLLFRDRFFMAASENDRDVLVSPLHQDQVALDRLLLLEEGHCLRDQALDICTGARELRIVKFGATSLPTLLQMVAHGMGQTLLPEIAIKAELPHNDTIRIVPFAPPEPARDIALFWRSASERRADYEAFATVAADVAATLLQPDRAAA